MTDRGARLQAELESLKGPPRSRSPPRRLYLPGPRRSFSSDLHLLTTTPHSRSSHHSSNSCSAPPYLSVLFLLTTARWEVEGRAEDAGGQPQRCALVRTLRWACPGRSDHRTPSRRPPDRRSANSPTQPARRDGAEQARADTSLARCGANVGTSAPSCPTSPACVRRRPASRPQRPRTGKCARARVPRAQ